MRPGRATVAPPSGTVDWPVGDGDRCRRSGAVECLDHDRLVAIGEVLQRPLTPSSLLGGASVVQEHHRRPADLQHAVERRGEDAAVDDPAEVVEHAVDVRRRGISPNTEPGASPVSAMPRALLTAQSAARSRSAPVGPRPATAYIVGPLPPRSGTRTAPDDGTTRPLSVGRPRAATRPRLDARRIERRRRRGGSPR